MLKLIIYLNFNTSVKVIFISVNYNIKLKSEKRMSLSRICLVLNNSKLCANSWSFKSSYVNLSRIEKAVQCAMCMTCKSYTFSNLKNNHVLNVEKYYKSCIFKRVMCCWNFCLDNKFQNLNPAHSCWPGQPYSRLFQIWIAKEQFWKHITSHVASTLPNVNSMKDSCIQNNSFNILQYYSHKRIGYSSLFRYCYFNVETGLCYAGCFWWTNPTKFRILVLHQNKSAPSNNQRSISTNSTPLSSTRIYLSG